MSDTQTTTTVTVPTDQAAYARWLASRMAALAHRTTRLEGAQLGDLERDLLRDAARDLLAALEA